MESTTLSTVLSVRSLLEYFCTVNLSFRTVLLSIRHVIFRLLWTFLQGSHPLKLLLEILHCVPHRIIFSVGSAFVESFLVFFGHDYRELILWDFFLTLIHCLLHRLIFFGVHLLEPSTIFVLFFLTTLWKTGCVLHFTHTCSFVGGFRCQFRALLYLSQFNPYGEYCSSSVNCGLLCTVHPRRIVVCSQRPRLL